MNQAKLKILESELKNKDWWYMMADDAGSYTAGSIHQKRIMDMVRDLGNDAVALYNKYAPSERLYIDFEILKHRKPGGNK